MKNSFAKAFLYLIFTITFLPSSFSQEPQWIWYPGDFSIWLHQEVSVRRQERNEVYPPFWRIDSHNSVVIFQKEFSIEKETQATLISDGPCQVRIDGEILYDYNKEDFILPKGKHSIEIKIVNYDHVPSIWFKAEGLSSNNSWLVTNQDKAWYPASSENFTDPEFPPSSFKLETEKKPAVKIDKIEGGFLIDFGKETFGFPILEECVGKGKVCLYYGESKEEAMAEKLAETYEYIDINSTKPKEYSLPASRAFRYIKIETPENVSIGNVSMLYEYLPLDYKGSFKCSDELINKIYDISYYTLHLNTREFHLDGIKRDRWVWSGDAYQSYLMNFYTFFDEAVNKRTIYALRGQDPVKTHINTILDYSFYWIIGIYDHYFYTGDTAFVKEVYPKMKTLMDFCISRANENGMVEGINGDWVFIDWAPISKEGELCFEQILFARSLEAMAKCASLNDEKQESDKYKSLFETLNKNINSVFWDKTQKAYIHGRKDGELLTNIYKYPNMFSILFDYATEEQKTSIKNNVLLNKDILKITTPYMKFYELAALCEINEQETVTDFVKDYWGGMLDLGATSIWEAFDPKEKGTKHYAMYGRPFGKSLCHAWGANPVYLFGKYYLGVKPTAPGYSEFEINPKLGGLEWMEGKVPVPGGKINIKVTSENVEVTSPIPGGILVLNCKNMPISKKGKWTQNKEGKWLLNIEKDVKYDIQY